MSVSNVRGGRALGIGLAVFVLGWVWTGVLPGAQAQGQTQVQDPDQAAQRAGQKTVRSAATELSVRGLVHADWVLLRQSSEDATDTSTGEPLNEERFVLRRARLRVTAQRGPVGGWVELDANTLAGPTVRVLEAVAALGLPSGVGAVLRPDRPLEAEVAAGERSSGLPIWLRALAEQVSVGALVGLLRLPFGFEVQEAATQRPFLERARFGQAFFGSARDLGAAAYVGYQALQLQLAVTNGEPLGTGNFALRDATAAKDLLGRVGVVWPVVPWLRVAVGLSALAGRGLSPGTAATKDSLQWVDDNENGLVEVVELAASPGVSATSSATFGRRALGADGRLEVRVPGLGPFILRGEVVRGVNLDRTVMPSDPVAMGRDLRQLGYVLGASQDLWGHVQLAVRYDVYNPDADASRRSVEQVVPHDLSYRTWSFAASGRLLGQRWLLQYDHQHNALGRSLSGSPTRLRDDRCTLRVELVL